MQKPEIEQRVRTAIGQLFGPAASEIAAETPLFDFKTERRKGTDLARIEGTMPDLDSLDQVELVMFVEDEFDIELPESVSHPLRTIAQFVDAIFEA
jgi:acyl carrier protein